MDGFVVHDVAPDLAVRIGRIMPDLPAAVDREVERLWQTARRRVAAGGAGLMFNGRVFSADVIGRHLVTGHLTEYRRVVAQMEQPALFAELGIRSFAVCGVLRCAGGMVVGRRHRAAIYQPGMWQLAPAGSVDASTLSEDGTFDLPRQLFRELREELGLGADAVGVPRPLCVVEHPGSHVSDLAMALDTDLDAEAVRATHRAGGNTEYDELRVVPQAGLAAFLAEAGAKLVPPARVFLKRAGWRIEEADSSR